MFDGMSDDQGGARGRVGQADFMDRAGAAVLKDRIEAYWLERGYDVNVALVDAPFSPAVRAARVDVRSEMLNGYPRRKRRDD